MNSYTRKTPRPESKRAEQSLLCASKHTEMHGKEKDIVEKPFPCKPVYHKKLVNSISHDEFIKKTVSNTSQEHVSKSTTLDKQSSRLPAGEEQMSRVIQEKQLMLQKKLCKVEDALLQKIQSDNIGFNNKCNSTGEHKYYEKQEMIKPDSKTEQGTQVTGKEVLIENQNNPKHKFRQDTIIKRHEPQDAKRENESTGKTMSKREKEGRATYVYIEPTQTQQKTTGEQAAGGNSKAAGRSAHEELVLPHVSPNPSWNLELDEVGETNIQLLPCHICHRKFLHDRVEKHIRICEKVTKSKCPVFNSYENRTKGTAAEDFWKTHTRSRTPEVLRKKKHRRQNKNNH